MYSKRLPNARQSSFDSTNFCISCSTSSSADSSTTCTVYRAAPTPSVIRLTTCPDVYVARSGINTTVGILMNVEKSRSLSSDHAFFIMKAIFPTIE